MSAYTHPHELYMPTYTYTYTYKDINTTYANTHMHPYTHMPQKERNGEINKRDTHERNTEKGQGEHKAHRQRWEEPSGGHYELCPHE